MTSATTWITVYVFIFYFLLHANRFLGQIVWSNLLVWKQQNPRSNDRDPWYCSWCESFTVHRSFIYCILWYLDTSGEEITFDYCTSELYDQPWTVFLAAKSTYRNVFSMSYYIYDFSAHAVQNSAESELLQKIGVFLRLLLDITGTFLRTFNPWWTLLSPLVPRQSADSAEWTYHDSVIFCK